MDRLLFMSVNINQALTKLLVLTSLSGIFRTMI